MYQDTITLFNRITADEGDRWIPTVIGSVELKVDRAAIAAKYGPQSQDRASLHIRYENTAEEIQIAGKTWQEPKQWSGMSDSLTLRSGTAFDFFWAGAWDGDDVIYDADYGPGGFFQHMEADEDNVFAITAVSRHKLIPHFEILGR